MELRDLDYAFGLNLVLVNHWLIYRMAYSTYMPVQMIIMLVIFSPGACLFFVFDIAHLNPVHLHWICVHIYVYVLYIYARGYRGVTGGTEYNML